MAGMISQAVVYPLDTLKFRMQCETVVGGERGNKLIWHTARKMWAHNGIVSFYRGLPMGLMGMFPYAAVDLFMFESLKKKMIARNAKIKGVKHDEDALPGNFTLALMGGFSGAFGASIVYPLNLLRTRLQSQGTAGHPRTYTGIMDVTRQTLKHEGTRGLFKGLTPNLLKVVPAVSIVSLTIALREHRRFTDTNSRPMSYTRTLRRRCICIRQRGGIIRHLSRPSASSGVQVSVATVPFDRFCL
jgi:solute carrier family 25 phosphate transporter 23/24/25/41